MGRNRDRDALENQLDSNQTKPPFGCLFTSVNKTGFKHADIEGWFEELLDSWFKESEVGYFYANNTTLQSSINAFFGTTSNPKTRAQVCSDFDMDSIIDDVMKNARARYKKIKPGKASTKSYLRYAVNDAIVATMKIMACLGLGMTTTHTPIDSPAHDKPNRCKR